MTDDLDPRRLLPATADKGVAASWLQADEVDEPLRHVAHLRDPTTLDDGLVGGQVDHTNAGVVAAVEDRADHQLDHRRVIDARGQRQGQCGGGVLGMGAQLIDVLGTRTFQADHEAAAEGHDQEHADCDQQLFEQRHLSSCS